MELVQHWGSYTSFSQPWMAKGTLEIWAGYRRALCVVRLSSHRKMSKIPEFQLLWCVVSTTQFPKPTRTIFSALLGVCESKAWHQTCSTRHGPHPVLSYYCQNIIWDVKGKFLPGNPLRWACRPVRALRDKGCGGLKEAWLNRGRAGLWCSPTNPTAGQTGISGAGMPFTTS